MKINITADRLLKWNDDNLKMQGHVLEVYNRGKIVLFNQNYGKKIEELQKRIKYCDEKHIVMENGRYKIVAKFRKEQKTEQTSRRRFLRSDVQVFTTSLIDIPDGEEIIFKTSEAEWKVELNKILSEEIKFEL